MISRISKVFWVGLTVLLISGCQGMGPFSCDATQARGAVTPTDKKLNYGVLSYEARVRAAQGRVCVRAMKFSDRPRGWSGAMDCR